MSRSGRLVPRANVALALLALPLALLAVQVVAPGAARAQGVEALSIEAPRDDARRIQIQAAYDHQFQTDVDKSGNFARDSVALFSRMDFELGDRFKLTPIFRWENHTYDFSDGAKRLGFQWNNVNYGLVGLLAAFEINAKWSLLGGPAVRYAGEAGADFGDSLDAGGLFGFLYHPSPRLQIGLVIGVVSGLEQDLTIAPIPMVRWQAGDEITLKVGVTQLGARAGVGPEFMWHPGRSVELAAGGVFVNRRFRLDDHGCTQRAQDAPPRCGRPANSTVGLAQGRSTRGIGQERSFPVYVRAQWKPLDGLGIEAFGAVVLGGELFVEEEFGDQIEQEEYDPTALVGLRAVYRF